MTTETEKKCTGCEIVYPLNSGYYKAGGSSYQKLCKVCHNKLRAINLRNSRGIKPKGFKAVPFEARTIILKDVNEGVKLTKTYEKIRLIAPKLSIATLRKLKRDGKIIAEPVPLETIEEQ